MGVMVWPARVEMASVPSKSRERLAPVILRRSLLWLATSISISREPELVCVKSPSTVRVPMELPGETVP